jgi:imidazole glycerol phosphate synthase glutamine amidotransferase subunit
MTQVTIIDTGIANTASVTAAFERLGCDVALSHDPGLIEDAPFVVLPGVGNFGAGMRALRSCKLDRVIIDRVENDRPLMGICLGLQLLFDASEESPGIEGLGIINAMVTRFSDDVRTPQHGWNRVGGEYAYYSNTYRIETIPEGWDGETSTHGSPFVAYLRRGTTLACQFHPELSGAWGADLMRAWVENAKEVAAC